MTTGFIRKKQSWKRFSVKAGSVLFLLALIALFFTRFHFAFDSQDDRCLPDHFIYLIDKKNQTIERDGIYAFSTGSMKGVFNTDKNVVKVLKGMPGDDVEVDVLENVIINGSVVAEGLALAEILSKPKALFIGKGKLHADEYWFMGETDTSYDSRYWGAVRNEQIIGRAYPVF